MLDLSPEHRWMQLAINEAQLAFDENEVPIGAVVVNQGKIVALGRNSKENDKNPTAHAEMIALSRASQVLGRWRLSDCSLYSTLEPCPMCVGAMLSARIGRLVFGCRDPKAGAVVSLFALADDKRMNHRIDWQEGVFARECSELLKAFFREKRK